MAREIGLLKVGMIRIDGTKIDANAAKVRSVRYDPAQELRAKLEADIAEEPLGDGKPDVGQEVPSPTGAAPAEERQSNLTDPDSQLMRKSVRHEYRQAYNAQAVVDADGSQLVLTTDVGQTPSDQPLFLSIIEQLIEEVEKPTTILADAGYAQRAAVEALEALDIEVLVAISRSRQDRPYDFRPPNPDKKPPREPKAPWRIKMAAKLKTDDAKAKYRQRKSTVEPVFGILKNVLGFTRFHLRGLQKVKNEWALLTLAYNGKRLNKMIAA